MAVAAYLVPQVMAYAEIAGLPAASGLAAGDPVRYGALAAGLALVVGLLCVLGRLVGAGALADLLSKPVLVGTEERLFMTLPTAVAAYHAWEADRA